MKKALIIGASSGIGKALSVQLAKEGYLVGITGRRKELLDEIAATAPDHFIVSAFDITDEGVVGYLDEIMSRLKGIDLMIISSGWGKENPELLPEVERQTIAVNVQGFTACMLWGFTYMNKHGGGHLAGISSIAGLRGSRYAPSYGATKAYQINFMEGLWFKAKNEKLPITVTDIRPGFVDTAMAQGNGVFWAASAEKAASQIIKALKQKKKYAYITKRWSLIAWLLNCLPSWIAAKF